MTQSILVMFVCAQHIQLDLKQSKYLHNTIHKQGLLLKLAMSATHHITADKPMNLCCVFTAIQLSLVPVPCTSLLARVGVKNNQRGSK
jgi:hypothetical protein